MKREQEIFEQAIALPSREAREGFLLGACGQDRELRRSVDELLAAFDDAGRLDFLQTSDRSQEAQTVPVDARLDEGPGTVIDRYKLLQKIGEGGMGVVYMAEQEEPVRRRVALKIIKLGMDTRQVVARFEAERQALAMMDHPNIARVLDGGATETGRPYFVMELVQGIPITEFCDKNKLPARERMRLFVQVCQAIQSAHQKGIIHRDIKPSNVLVTLHHGEPMPKVIDFGIAKATDQKLTEKTLFTNHATMIGTPAYMSPEQAEMTSMDVDTRTDVYSLGVLLYELLTGSTPFPEKRLRSLGYGEMQRVIVDEEPERPSTRLSTMANEQKTAVAKNRGEELAALSKLLRGDLDWVVMRCLEKDRRRRYDTPNELVADIERHLKDEPVVARPPTVIYRFQKMVRRNKLAFAAVAAIATALVLGAVVSTWQAFRATRAQKATLKQRVAAETAQASEKEHRLIAQQKQAEAEAQRQRAETGESNVVRQLYVDHLNLAQAAWEMNNVSRVRQLLEDTATAPERGFEWYYWQRQAHLEEKTLRGHLGPVLAVAYSPDGRWIVTGGADKTARVWDAASGKYLFALRGHLEAVRSVAFSPDGQRIVTGSWDRTAMVWEAATGKPLRSLSGHEKEVFSVAVSRDGRRIVTGSRDHTAKLWDATSGAQIRTFKGHSGVVWSVAISPDGERIVTGSWDKTVKVWTATNDSPLLTFDGHNDPVFSVDFSPDGERIVSGSFDETAKVWEAATGKVLGILEGHSAPVFSVAFSPDGRRIATAGDDQTARVWAVGGRYKQLTVKKHGSPISSVAFSPDGERIVTGGGSVGFSPEGEQIVVGSGGDRTAKVWRVSNDKELLTLNGHTDQVWAVAFSRDGQRIVTGSLDRTAKVWDAASGLVLHTLRGHTHAIHSVAISPDGQRIVTGGWDGTAKVWDTASGELLLTLLYNTNIMILRVAFSPNGRRIAAVGESPVVKVWDAASGELQLTFEGAPIWIWSVAFSPDSHRILTANEDPGSTAKLWDAVTGKELRVFKGHESWLFCAAFSPDGQRIVTSSDDHTIRVWDATSSKELLPPLNGHSDQILSASFSPDGQRIVSCSRDQTVRVWDAASGKELLTLKGRSGWIFSVAFSPDGKRIVGGNWDGTAKVWEAASAEEVASWRNEEQAAAESQQRERAAAAAEAERAIAQRANLPGVMKQWLVLGPIAFEGTDGKVALDQEQMPNEARLRPRADQRVVTGAGELVWKAVRQGDYWLDFNQLMRKTHEFTVAYAVTYIRSETDRTGLLLKIGSDDQAKIFLNEKEVYRVTDTRSWEPDRDTVPDIDLKAGLNLLVFKVVNEKGGWGGSVRLTDAQGSPVKGIKVTLDPEANERTEIKQP